MSKAKLVMMGLLAATLGLGATGCASTSITKVSTAAPITYKMGDGATQYASLAKPTLPKRFTPKPYQPETALPTPAPTQRFDQATVDQDLYKHQRIGKKYKIRGKSYTPKHQPTYDVTGTASWYGDKFHGKPTATGETYNMHAFTAAHKTLPLNSMLFVTNVKNGKTLMVRLNDRGPFVGDRIIDLSKASAKALGIQGLGEVRVQYAGPADPMAASRAPVRPSRPVPMPQENIVEAPAPRSLPTPQPAMPFTQPNATPVAPAPVLPEQPTPVSPDMTDPKGQITLTIKGPIHVAKFEGPQPRLIRERLKTK